MAIPKFGVGCLLPSFTIVPLEIEWLPTPVKHWFVLIANLQYMESKCVRGSCICEMEYRLVDFTSPRKKILEANFIKAAEFSSEARKQASDGNSNCKCINHQFIKSFLSFQRTRTKH